MTDHKKRIREALEAGPTEREWLIDHRDPRFVYALNVEGYNQFWAHVQGPHTRTFELEANARLIAACNPAAIRALLADLDAMRGALKSVQAAIYMDDAGQLRLTRSFDESTIDAALKGASA